MSAPRSSSRERRARVAAALGVKPDDITLKTTFLGGGFGRRLELDFVLQAVQVSKAVGKPVKVLWTREDDMAHDYYRPQALNQLQAGVDKDGNPVALKFKVTSQSVTQRAFGLPKDTLDPFMAEAAVAAYEIPNTQHDLVINDAGLRVGYWRAVSHNMNAFANESFMDELAANAKKDPYEFRMGLLKGKPRFANVFEARRRQGRVGQAPACRSRARHRAHGGLRHLHGAGGGGLRREQQGEGAPRGRGGRSRPHGQPRHRRGADPEFRELRHDRGAQEQDHGSQGAASRRATSTRSRVLRMDESPQIDIVVVESTEKPGGIGEPATALIGPAIANAVFAQRRNACARSRSPRPNSRRNGRTHPTNTGPRSDLASRAQSFRTASI